MTENSNYNNWKLLQVEVNANKVVNVDFSKTDVEKAQLASAKYNWRKQMRAVDPEFKKREWSRHLTKKPGRA